MAMHSRLAKALELSGISDPDVLAVHYEDAGDLARASDYYCAAGDQAAKAPAFDRAATMYRQAMETATLADSVLSALRKKLADSLANAGRGSEAAREYLLVAQDVP